MSASPKSSGRCFTSMAGYCCSKNTRSTSKGGRARGSGRAFQTQTAVAHATHKGSGHVPCIEPTCPQSPAPTSPPLQPTICDNGSQATSMGHHCAVPQGRAEQSGHRLAGWTYQLACCACACMLGHVRRHMCALRHKRR
eukprot:363481-Chlamydomonas_euryale.AAC.9